MELPFLFMPFEHSESLKDHHVVHQKYNTVMHELEIKDPNSPSLARLRGFMKYELDHYEIIKKFGRYPHRNVVLGRTSTVEEIEFLKQHGGF